MLQKLHGNKENEETIIDGDQDISWPKNGIKASIPEHDSKVGGRLMLFKKARERAPRWQRTVVCYGAGWKFIQNPPNPPRVTQSNNPKIEKQLLEFINSGVVIETKQKPKWNCRLFTREKPDKSTRLIADLSSLNEYIKPINFKMPTIEDLKKQLNQPKWLLKIDIKDAVLHIPVKPFFQSFLGIRFKQKYYRFSALMFGL